MPGVYVVKQGDCLSSIAQQFRIPWKKIYYDPANADFRKKRPNPNVIYPGDKLVIPDHEKREEDRPADAQHNFVSPGSKLLLRIVMLDADGAPLGGFAYQLEVAGQKLSGTTGADGMIEQKVPPGVQPATLSLWLNPKPEGAALQWSLLINHLDPVEYLTGVQARLNNLGYHSGPVDGLMGPITDGAVREFQEKYKLQVDGIPGPITQGKLKDIHGC